LPRWLGDIHPQYRTPYKAVLLIGLLSAMAPLFGRQTMVWLVDAGSFGTIVAYAFVALSFLVLRRNEPEMERPYRVRYGRTIGSAAFVCSTAIAILFLPFSPAALLWPYEWVIVGGWCILGVVLMLFAGGEQHQPEWK